jgi:type IX secretion system PorP/SprF family membrane protein
MRSLFFAAVLAAAPLLSVGQSYPHYTMFMYNKLTYNPGYAGSRDLLSVNGTFRNQWTGIAGAPINYNLSLDAPVGRRTDEFQPIAAGLTLNRESIGPTTTTMIAGACAYRIRFGTTVLSGGLRAGASLYSARYSDLNLVDANDDMLSRDIRNAILPNVGAGLYWSSKRFYLGLSVPDFLQNYYDKDQANYPSGKQARQMRSTYLSGGYLFPVSEKVSLLPQTIVRYAKDARYELPVSADINLTAIFYQRLMIGASYRTDKSIQGIVHLQAGRKLNIGYAFDYSMSDFGRYAQGSHELMIGFDLKKDLNDYADPRFIKDF